MPLSNSINHPICFDLETGTTIIADNTRSIHESLRLLLSTSYGELLGDPNFHTDLLSLLYEPNNEPLIDMVKTNILNAVSTYEPRITMTYNDIIVAQVDSLLYVSLTYVVKNTGMRNTLELQLALREGY